MAATTLCIYVYYEEKQQQAFFDDCFPSCLKSTQASVPGLLPRNHHPTINSFHAKKLSNVLPSRTKVNLKDLKARNYYSELH
jgi:hypothetical protein